MIPIPIDKVANAARGNEIASLQNIHAPEVNIAILHRSVDHLEHALQALLELDISARSTGTPEQVLSAFHTLFQQQGLASSPVLADIKFLLQAFQEVTRGRTFRVLLTTVKTNMCKRFHTDINDLRMLCTYVGAGTLWAAEREEVGVARLPAEEDGSVNPHPQSIQQVNSGDVIILKGALYPNGKAVVHRSPAIETEGSMRLLLRIDTNENHFG